SSSLPAGVHRRRPRTATPAAANGQPAIGPATLADDFYGAARSRMRRRLAQQVLQRLLREASLAQKVTAVAGGGAQAPRATPPWRAGAPPSLAHKRPGGEPHPSCGPPLGHQHRHGLGARQRLLGGLQQPPAAFADVVRIFLIARAPK